MKKTEMDFTTVNNGGKEEAWPDPEVRLPKMDIQDTLDAEDMISAVQHKLEMVNGLLMDLDELIGKEEPAAITAKTEEERRDKLLMLFHDVAAQQYKLELSEDLLVDQIDDLSLIKKYVRNSSKPTK